MPRSVNVHPDYQPALAIALARSGFLTQGDLAAHLEVALSTVSNFFRGVKVSVSKFEQICEALGLDQRSIIQPQTPQLSSPTPPNSAPPALADTFSPDSFFAYDESWVGREALVAELTAKLTASCRLLLLAGMAGIGKTALAERLILASQVRWVGQTGDITDAIARRPFRLLRENLDHPDQAQDFISVAARWLTACGETVTPGDRQHPQIVRTRLLRQFQQNTYLLVIDSLEQILIGNEQTGWSQFKDPEFLTFFQAFLSLDSCRSQMILTTQQIPAQLIELGDRYPNFWHRQPLYGLSAAEQLHLFAKTGLDVALEHDYWVRIGQAYEGHPLALRVIAGEIGSRPFYGNVAAYWNRYGDEIETVEMALAEAAAGMTVGAADRWQLDRFSQLLRRSVRSRLDPDFSPRFSKLAYKPCQISFSGEGQKKQSVILPNQPRIQWGLGLSGFSRDL